MATLKLGQQVRHAGFKGIGTVVQIRGVRVTVDFPETNGIIDDRWNFYDVKVNPPKRRKRQSCSLIRTDYD